ncbi:hypothetical protein CHS0354_018259, partial [Potamilus streckersoni]
MELVGPSKRLWAGIVNEYFFALGLLVIGAIAFALRDWKDIELITDASFAVYLLYWWMVASMVYYGLTLNTGNLGGDFHLNFIISGLVEFPAYTFGILLLNRLGRKKLHCSSMLLWRIACLSTILTVLYGGDVPTADAFATADPVASTISAISTVRNRNIVLAISETSAAGSVIDTPRESLMSAMFQVSTTLRPAFTRPFDFESTSMIGQIVASAAFGIIDVSSAELYPTVVQNSDMGGSSCCVRRGGMVAPYVVDL